jgi:hypothetical protein
VIAEREIKKKRNSMTEMTADITASFGSVVAVSL